MRRILRWSLAGLLLLALLGAYLAWDNNRPATMPEQSRLESALENSIQWLTDNRTSVLDNGNPMLWYMVEQAAELSGDQRLTDLFGTYRARYLEGRSGNIWRLLFYPKTWLPVRWQDISAFPDYNQHFVYAMTCDRELAQIPEIAAQNAPDFCDSHPLRPACATHQMMGALLLKRSACGDPKELDQLVRALQQRIHRQLTWDPRVVDVYMQRVLMLAASGASKTVKPIWVQRLLDAQQPDGGWSGFMPLIPVGGQRFIGIDQLPGVRAPKSDFHMTAQGVLLLTLLTHPGSAP